MIVIPAVDIKNGKCVRLLQGQMDKETVFSDSPLEMAEKWEEKGATLLHVVDLDGAFEKTPKNLSVIEKIVSKLNIEVQVGGGIRDMETISGYLDLGVKRVIIGTEAIRNPDLVVQAAKACPDRIVVGIDAKDGLVAIEGWTTTTKEKAIDLAKRFENCGASAIVFTDIRRDGMQTGVNTEATGKLARSVSIPVIASGGVSSLEDIRGLLPLEKDGVVAVITGRALYTGALDLSQAIQTANQVLS